MSGDKGKFKDIKENLRDLIVCPKPRPKRDWTFMMFFFFIALFILVLINTFLFLYQGYLNSRPQEENDALPNETESPPAEESTELNKEDVSNIWDLFEEKRKRLDQLNENWDAIEEPLPEEVETDDKEGSESEDPESEDPDEEDAETQDPLEEIL